MMMKNIEIRGLRLQPLVVLGHRPHGQKDKEVFIKWALEQKEVALPNGEKRTVMRYVLERPQIETRLAHGVRSLMALLHAIEREIRIIEGKQKKEGGPLCLH